MVPHSPTIKRADKTTLKPENGEVESDEEEVEEEGGREFLSNSLLSSPSFLLSSLSLLFSLLSLSLSSAALKS